MDTAQSTQKHILITGASGFLGKLLTNNLLGLGYQVSHLSRQAGNNPQVKSFVWDVEKGEIDEKCIDSVNIIIHLAGAGVADKKWTAKRKKEIIDSRTKSIQLIYQLLKNKLHTVDTIISASGVGYYGACGDAALTEENPKGLDFLAECCVAWEVAVDEGSKLGLRILKFRTGVVLDKNNGALAKIALLIKWGLGAALGNGKQWVPWIHWQDAIAMYVYGVEHTELNGVYNMVSPHSVTNKQLTQQIAHQLNKPLWLPNVPALLLKLLLGEMSTIVLGSARASADKIIQAGYTIKYPELAEALKEIYG